MLAAAAVVGAGAFLLSLFVWPLPSGGGGWLVRRYQDVSLDPFKRAGYSHRILAPLVAHVLHLDGERFHYVTLACSPLLLACVYVFGRLRGVTPVGAAAMTVAIALSRTVGNSNLIPGLTDTVTYLLLLLTVMAIARPLAFWALVALNLLNHEQAFFVLPWLLYLRYGRGEGAGAVPVRSDAWRGLVVVGLYAALRAWLGSGTVGLHVVYVTSRPAMDWVVKYLLVWWFALTSFGFLLVCFFAHASRGGFQRRGALLCCACAAAPYLVAWDPPRYVHLAFVGILLAAVDFLRVPGRVWWFLAMLCGNVLIYLASERILEAFVASVSKSCRNAPDPEWCIHFATTSITAPSLVALPLLWWMSRGFARRRASEEDDRG
jgi:hypothetical protein